MTEYWNDTFDERLDETYAEDVATLTGRVDITSYVASAELENLPQTQYVKAVAEYGNSSNGFGVAILPGAVPPLSTMSVATELRVLIEALPNHDFSGALLRTAAAKYGYGRSRINVFERTVRF